ncbi:MULTISPECIES: phage head closure protein [Bacillus]|uniref:Phage head closure protein n=1 Tax=Bacillus subtilis TaxID=1423 RepID=A0AAQ3EY71_BACIU|nr:MULTISPECIES: phage head closure protein [Bacillus]AYK58501.1 head-tail adaptor protein [Bacillus subtilis subsp. subtilis]MCX4078176.1 phage head closure protein [Bacillus subtilis]MDK7656561.1 phage head closure protein [Bacillus subtilis]MEC0287097.1 phage head closure protein [Bacillus subtilis]MEC0292401.1 phage head closure protein [Bacillus subtilis]
MRKKISQLRHRLTFQKKESTQDEELNWNEGYIDLFTVWGSIEGFSSLGNNQTVIAGALGVKSPKKITIRYRDDVQQDMRVVKYVGQNEKNEPVFRTFDVIDFNDPEDNKEELEIMCQEVGLNG